MKIDVRPIIAAAILLACASQTPSALAADDPHAAQIETLRKSHEKYQDYKVAVRDLYLSTVGCVHYSGEKVDGDPWNTPRARWACTSSTSPSRVRRTR